jgi:hypothetical protein
MSTPNSKKVWQQQQERNAEAFRTNLQARIDALHAEAASRSLPPLLRHELKVSFAHRRGSQNWFTTSIQWAALLSLLNSNLPRSNKDGIILVPGSLSGGAAPAGTRRLKRNVDELNLVVLDYDKGDATLDDLDERLSVLGLEGCIYATYSHLKDVTELAWSVARPDPKTGQIEIKGTAFQKFVREKLRRDDEDQLDPKDVSTETVLAFMIEQLGFQADVLGDVEILQRDKIESEFERRKSGETIAVETRSFVIKHKPIAKSRLVLPLSSPFVRETGESDPAFQERWQREVYHPVAKLIGFNFDPSCASTERGHYAMTRDCRKEAVPARYVEGNLLDPSSEAVKRFLAPANGYRPEAKREEPSHARIQIAVETTESLKWQGFLAADAAADTIGEVTDKRADESSPLVAFSCPFVHEHATSNKATAHQCYAYNARNSAALPTVKCQSATCKDRPFIEFLEALFDDAVNTNPKYRVTLHPRRTGIYIPRADLEAKLHEINENWAIVRIGNKTRYLHLSVEGDVELYDSKSVSDWFSNWFYYTVTQQGTRTDLIFPAWCRWQYRRQYRGVRFCPEPQGAPEGVFNTYFGYSVEPKRGSWKRLLAHIYRNICRRNPIHFRFFVAWLAQLVQSPHIKPGTNIVLKGREGVGKSKVGEWIKELFDRNAIVVSEAERITGRFNGHLENKLFMMAEEAFWAGDKAAEGKLKDLATGTHMSYERKGLDAYEGKNYTRIMIASNEDWIVPASSGGRRWFVLEVGDEHQKDFGYFAAIDAEMRNGGLEAMLYDLLQTDLPQTVQVRDAPVTPWLVEQRQHSYSNKHRWWRGVLQEGGFRDNGADTFVPLNLHAETAVRREDTFSSAKPYFAGPRGVDPTPGDVGQFISKMLGKLNECRPTIDGKRCRCTIFPPLEEMRQRWLEETGERIEEESTRKAPSPRDEGRYVSPALASKVCLSLGEVETTFAVTPPPTAREKISMTGPHY